MYRDSARWRNLAALGAPSDGSRICSGGPVRRRGSRDTGRLSPDWTEQRLSNDEQRDRTSGRAAASSTVGDAAELVAVSVGLSAGAEWPAALARSSSLR